jgi:hypothetical protein
MSESRGLSWRQQLLAGFVALIGHSVLLASPPQVTFDVASQVPCHDVTTDEFHSAFPREKLVEARLQISTLVRSEDASEVTELFIRLDSPERSLCIADYFPKTTLSSEYAGNVGIEEKDEQASNLGLNAAGSYGPLSAASTTLSTADKTANCKRYELLPPLETVAASGTLDRANGVYYKLRPTSRSSVEGAQEVVVVLRVPAAWRADYVAIRCQAFSRARRIPFGTQETQISGHGRFLVALYLSGDEPAQAAATAFVRAESELRHIAVAQREEIERRSAPTPVHELAVQLSVKQPRIPPTWLEQVLVGPDRDAVGFLGFLPAPVRESAMDYFAVRRKLRAINSPATRLPKVDSGQQS